MNVWELKEIIANLPDSTPIVVEGEKEGDFVRAWGVSHEQATCINGTFHIKEEDKNTLDILIVS